MKRFLSLLLATAPWLSRGVSFDTNPTADAFVTTGPSGNLSGNNYGGAGALSLAAPGSLQGELQSVLQFNVGGAVASFNNLFGVGQWSIQSVTLQLTAALANNSIFNTPAAGLFGISWMQNDSWSEGSGTPGAPGASGITFASLQSTVVGAGDESLGTFSFNGAISGMRSYSLDLQPGFQSDLLAGESLSLRLSGADNSVSAVFNSRSFGTAANRPLLTIIAVPEPRTVALGVGGGLGIVAVRFARKRKA
jgi:hypothetical protein